MSRTEWAAASAPAGRAEAAARFVLSPVGWAVPVSAVVIPASQQDCTGVPSISVSSNPPSAFR
ncbi:hypothetical protein GCM10010234_66230 [Streptomyces hawaiiensis]